jgi:hypothetical protein
VNTARAEAAGFTNLGLVMEYVKDLGTIESMRRYFGICHSCRAERLLTGVAKVQTSLAPAAMGKHQRALVEQPHSGSENQLFCNHAAIMF